MTTVEVKFDDVIKLILQFLKQNKLENSFHTLQKETSITLNTIDTAYLAKLVSQGSWDVLLQEMNYLMPSQETLFDLYELIIDDLIERDRFQAASFLIRKLLTPNQTFQQNHKQKILRLEYICEKKDQKALYLKPVTQSRKQNIIRRLTRQTHQGIQNSRLLKLLTEALRYQAKQGLIKASLSVSLYENKQRQLQVEIEEMIKNVEKVVKYGEQSKITSITVSNKGDYIALGGVDGLIQIYDPIDYSLHRGLSYQAEDVLFYHEDGISGLKFNDTDELLASSDFKGTIKIWNMQTGRLMRKFNCHQRTVGCMCWGMDLSHLLIGYQAITLYSILSCTALKQYSQHENQYLLAIFAHAYKLYSFTLRGTLRIHHYSTQEHIHTVSLNQVLLTVSPLYNHSTEEMSFLVCGGSYCVEVNDELIEGKKYTCDGQFSGAVAGWKWCYETYQTREKEQKLQVRDRVTGKILHSAGIEGKVETLALLFQRNLLLTYDMSHNLNFWRP